MSIPVVEEAGPADRERIGRIMTLGFSADPMTRWLWPDADAYVTTMPVFTAAFGGPAFAAGTAFLAEGGRAAALWFPPGVGPDEERLAETAVAHVAPERLEDVAVLMEKMAAFHPEEPHWYLAMIAADPAFMGRGLGAALLKHTLARCDGEGLPAYLESSNPRNMSLYERHGFETIGEIRSDRSPTLYAMLRPARR
ncbi:MAG: GNAT family N-acetyltransferase [Alphaproteobacteria bacterium]|nr:GNAT family N-acetyltransferase [Alphaproteobacteria bacterium]